MKKMSARIAFVTALAFVFAMAVSGVADAKSNRGKGTANKVGVCHVRAGKAPRLITVAQSAVQAHLDHGDVLATEGGFVGENYVGANADCSVTATTEVSSILEYPNGIPLDIAACATVSCPVGTVVVGGGYEPASATVALSQAAKPDTGTYPSYPCHEFVPPETGWVVQNNTEAKTLTEIYVFCAPAPELP